MLPSGQARLEPPRTFRNVRAVLDSNLIGNAVYAYHSTHPDSLMSPGSTPDFHGSSIVVLGADTVLAAVPATPVQLAHACHALGYDMAYPASWGDEIVASACLERLATFGNGPAIICACPHVIQRLTRSGTELAPYMIALVSPPVAAARYLRALYGEHPVQITFVGTCPSATDPSIDVRISPEELFAAFSEHGIELLAQPELFDSVLPPDRRRFYSVPGGAPSAERMAELGTARALTELEDGDDEFALDLAQRLLAGRCEVIDPAPRLGCACSGVLVNGASHGARAALTALEPPRANGPVLDPAIRVEVALSISDSSTNQAESAAPGMAAAGESESAIAAAPGQAGAGVARLATGSDSDTRLDETEDASRSEMADWTVAGVAGVAGPSARSAIARRRPAATLRRPVGRAPSLVRRDGAVIPRAYAARAPRPGATRKSARDTGREREREQWGHRSPLADAVDAPRRSKRLGRPVVIPLSCEPPRSVPPPPAKQHSSSTLDVGMILGEA